MTLTRLAPLIHPFLLAALPVIISLALVKQMVLPEEAIAILLALELITVVTLFICWLIVRDIQKACIICSGILLYTFLYRVMEIAINRSLSQLATPPDWLILVIYVVMGIIAFPILTLTKYRFGKYVLTVQRSFINESLTIIFLSLLVMNLAPVVQYELRIQAISEHSIASFSRTFSQLKLDQNAEKRDVYYIILDGFANWKALKDIWGFDNHEFADFLTAKGFYVVPRAASNYDRTEFSLASSLNMQYLDSMGELMSSTPEDLNPYSRLMQFSCVPRLFKSLGYKFINLPYAFSESTPVADQNLLFAPVGDFTLALVGLTPLFGTEKYFPLIRNIICEMRTFPEKGLPQVFSISGPKFVFIHTELSHAPMVFDREGKRLPIPTGHFMIDWGTPSACFEQWQFAQKMAMHWISMILAQPGKKPIIIIQSDHGSGIALQTPHAWFNERMKILNAYYFPEEFDHGLYDTITPVNSFRVLFNDYFGANLPLLPDRVMCSPDYANPYGWKDVRTELDYPDRAK